MTGKSAAIIIDKVLLSHKKAYVSEMEGPLILNQWLLIDGFVGGVVLFFRSRSSFFEA